MELPLSFNLSTAEFVSSIFDIEAYAGQIHQDRVDRYFTDHGVPHSLRITILLNQLLAANKQQTMLSEIERYVLLAAVFLHDIGTQNEFMQSDDKSRREEHEFISSRMITESWREIGLVGDLVEAVSKVVEGHRGTIDDTYRPITVRTCQTIRCDLLAALIQIGDELDVTHERVNLTRKKALNYPPEADLHFYKHYYTESIAVTDRQEVSISFRYPNGRASQYHPFFSKIVLGKISRSIDGLTEVLGERHKIFLLLSDISPMKETNTVESIPADRFEQISIGYRNLKPLSSFPFEKMVGDVNAELFYKGSLRWEDIVNGLDIKRNAQEPCITAIRSLLDVACAYQDRCLFLITGMGGSGKSTFLRRLAYQIHASDEFRQFTNILWHPEEHHLDIDEITFIYNATLKPILVFIDAIDAGRLVSALSERIEQPFPRIPVVFIISARNSEWINSKAKLLRFQKSDSVLLEKLAPEEIVLLIERLKFHNQLYYLTDKTDEERYKAFADKSERELLVGMLEATRGRNFEEIILDEYVKLKDVAHNAATAYEYISLFYLYNSKLPKSLIMKVVHCVDDAEFTESILNKTPLMIVFDRFEYGQEYFRPRHRVIAERLLKQVADYDTPVKCLKRAMLVLQLVDPFNRTERYVIMDFLNLFLDMQIRLSKAEFDDRLFEARTCLEHNRPFILNIIKCAADNRHLSELYVWSKLFGRVGLYDLNTDTLRQIVKADRHNKNANYALAKQLLKRRGKDRNNEEIIECFSRSYVGRNRRIAFLHDYLKFAVRNAFDEHLEKLFDTIENCIARTPDEEDLRHRMEVIIAGYREQRDKRALSENISSLSNHVAITRDMTARDLFEYIDTVQHQNVAEVILTYEEYLQMTNTRPKSVILTLAHLLTRMPGRHNEAIKYFDEVFTNYIRPVQSPNDVIILLDYARLGISSALLRKEKVYEILRFAINLQETDLLSYLLLSQHAIKNNDKEMAHNIASSGIEVARRIGRYQSGICEKLRVIYNTSN